MKLINTLIDKIKLELNGKKDVVKRMVLNGLIQFVDIRNQDNYMEKVIIAFQLIEKIPVLEKDEAFILRMEMTNVACAFSGLSDQDAQKIKDFLIEEREKYDPKENESLEAFMREALGSRIYPFSVFLYHNILAEALLAIVQGFNDERFNFELIKPVNKEEIKEKVREIVKQYYQQKGMKTIWERNNSMGIAVWASAELNQEGKRRYVYCTVTNSHILVTERELDW